MYSLAILFALITITNAIGCRPLTCMIACPYGFEVDAQSCPICTCRRSPYICAEPIQGYTCGLMDGRDCPSTHECRLGFTGLSGQCCLKQTGSSTASPKSTNRLMVTGTTTTKRTTPTTTTAKTRPTTTTKPRTTTTKPRTTTHRMFKRFVSTSTDAVSGSSSSSSFVATTTQS